MPITLISGTPGAGKSLYAVKMLLEEILPSGRPVFTNINGFSAPKYPNLTLCGHEGPMKWQEFPDGAYCVFDEVQDQYPFKNGMSTTPPYIRGYEKHRHQGKDFIFITQGPYLLDRHLHPLIDRHIHVYRPFGFKRSTVKEWQGLNPKPEPLQSNANAGVRNFNFPKKYFEHYKSATLHTVKLRFPWKLAGMVALLGGAVVGVAVMGYKSYHSDLFQSPASKVAASVAANGGAAPGTEGAGPCALIKSITQAAVRAQIAGNDYLLARNAVVIADGVLTVGGQSALAWPLCVSAG